MDEPLEIQVRARLRSAYQSVYGDDVPQQRRVANPVKAVLYQQVLLQEQEECIVLLAQEVDRLSERERSREHSVPSDAGESPRPRRERLS
ncbi:MAG: hypothetical protein ACRDVF_17380 [Microbacterium sp.]|uniref:hypothetical protein n=1 Tax=Microbacterium sp. TaxID=51671 RepID=UPI003D6DDDF5